jgi:polar amino acid transport system substrate-binding protein
MAPEQRLITLVADPFPPYQYMQGGAISGLDYELIQQAYRSQGFEIAVSLHPWDECVRRMDEASADGAFQVAKTPERERRFLFSDLLRTARTVFYCHASNPVALRREDLGPQLRGLTTAVVSGYSYGARFDELPGIRKLAVSSNEESLLALAARRADLAIIDEGVGAYLLATLRLRDTLQRVPGVEIERPLFVAFHPTRADCCDAFNCGQTAIRQRGVYDALMAKYGLR